MLFVFICAIKRFCLDSSTKLSIKRGTHLGINAIKMLKKISLARLTQVGT